MTVYPLLLVAGAAAAAFLFALLFRLAGGRRRRDLIAPPKPRPRRLSREELDALTELVGAGGEAEALRRLKDGGYSEAQVRRLVWLMAKLAED